MDVKADGDVTIFLSSLTLQKGDGKLSRVQVLEVLAQVVVEEPGDEPLQHDGHRGGRSHQFERHFFGL